jgi:hypothetical protein
MSSTLHRVLKRAGRYTAAVPIVAFLGALHVNLAQAQLLDWATQASGTDTEIGLGIAADADGNSTVTGSFEGTVVFGDGEANETTLVSSGFADLFVAKYGPNGQLLWATQAGGTDFDAGDGIAVDADGNILVTGDFADSAIFGDGEANETTLVSAGSIDLFVAKYAPSGLLLWAKQAGGAGFLSDGGADIALDADGNSTVTGSFAESAVFGDGEANETTLVSAGSNDLFVAKYAPSGQLLWATQAGGANLDQGHGIALDADGNSTVTGGFFGSAVFGDGEANETTLVGAQTGRRHER